MASVTALPAAYAKFITALLGEAVAYVSAYGTTWHLVPALVMAGAALAVLGVPNAPAPVAAAPPIPGIRAPEPPSGTVKVQPPQAGA